MHSYKYDPVPDDHKLFLMRTFTEACSQGYAAAIKVS